MMWLELEGGWRGIYIELKVENEMGMEGVRRKGTMHVHLIF